MNLRYIFKLDGNSPNNLKLTGFLLMTLFLVSQFIQLHTGYADNGDFRRVNQLFTDSPIGFSAQPPEPGTPERALRYNKYWLPEWNFRPTIPSIYSAFSSIVLLWIPGALINYFFISSSILYLVVLSIFPRLLVGLCILCLIVYFSNDKRHALWLYMCIILPLILLLSTSDYSAYFNSFYQESGSLVYFLLLVTWFLTRGKLSNKHFFVTGYSLLFLLTIAKSSNFYFPFLFLPFIFDQKKAFQKPIRAIFVLTLVLFPVVFTVTFVGDRSDANLYNSLFFGVLVSSEHPEQRLLDIGISDPDAINCRKGFFSAKGSACYQKYREKVSLYSLVKVILREPKILVHHAERLANTMQKTDIGRGKYAVDDKTPRNDTLLNGWALFKQEYFPQGWGFYWFLFAEGAIACFLRRKSRHPLIRELSTLALILLLACWMDMWIAIMGDGIADLVKHLFLTNVMFDMSVLITIAIMGIAFLPSSIFSRRKTAVAQFSG